MHLKHVLRLFLISFAFSIFTTHGVRAQKNEPPSGQPGIGVYASTYLLSGVDFTYAISSNMQAGSLFTLSAGSGGGGTNFLFGPFFRYQFSGTVSPFVEGGLVVQGNGGATSSGIFMGGGFAYYLNRTIGMHAGVELLNLLFSPSGVVFGFNSLIIGADWYL